MLMLNMVFQKLTNNSYSLLWLPLLLILQSSVSVNGVEQKANNEISSSSPSAFLILALDKIDFFQI
jgi:hypothetical protein